MKKLFMILFLLISISATSFAQINPPDQLVAEVENPLFIKVTWNDNSNNETGFYVQRTTVLIESAWQIIGGAPEDVRRFDDYNITHNTKYYYRAYAFGGGIRSDNSNIDSAIAGDTTKIPAAPTNLRVMKSTMTSINIRWDDNANNENGFILARKRQGDILFEYIDSVGTDVLTYHQVGLRPGINYFYKVCAYNSHGISYYSNIVSNKISKSKVEISTSLGSNNFFLNNNYPNPFNPSTTIKFGISGSAFVSLKVYNTLGEEVQSLFNRDLNPGTYEVTWNARDFPTGMYFYEIETHSAEGNFNEIKRMILIK